jgi:hypothetical protein
MQTLKRLLISYRAVITELKFRFKSMHKRGPGVAMSYTWMEKELYRNDGSRTGTDS